MRHPTRAATLWLTGLSGAGKTTISARVCEQLRQRGHRVEVLDGDAVRERLCRGLGFQRADREENIRRIAFVAELLTRNGVFTIVSAISPYRQAREEARRSIGDFVEVYVSAPLAVCEARDVKGLYQKARAGQIAHFTGIDDPYEPPTAPEITCPTHEETPEESAARVIEGLHQRGYL